MFDRFTVKIISKNVAVVGHVPKKFFRIMHMLFRLKSFYVLQIVFKTLPAFKKGARKTDQNLSSGIFTHPCRLNKSQRISR